MSNERSHRPSCSTTIGTTEPMIMATSCNVQLVGCTHHSATRRLHMIRKEIVLPATRDDVWEALTDPERLEDWFANDVDLDLRPGGGASFRWANGEERHAVVREVEPGERLAFDWEDEGEVEFTLADGADGTLLAVVETSPAWSTALDVQASFGCAAAGV